MNKIERLKQSYLDDVVKETESNMRSLSVAIDVFNKGLIEYKTLYEKKEFNYQDLINQYDWALRKVREHIEYWGQVIPDKKH